MQNNLLEIENILSKENFLLLLESFYANGVDSFNNKISKDLLAVGLYNFVKINTEIIVTPETEESHPEDSYSLEDEEKEKEIIDNILSQLEYNEWAWCNVKVEGVLNVYDFCDEDELSSVEYLGSVSEKDEKTFCDSSYYQSMVDEIHYKITQKLYNFCIKNDNLFYALEKETYNFKETINLRPYTL